MSQNSTHRTISASYVQGTKNLRIIGTQVVPEFPPGMVLVVSLMATLMLHSLIKRKNNDHLGSR